MLGSEFVSTYGRKGLNAWEPAAIMLASDGKLTPWPFVDLPLSDGANTVILRVQSDVLAIGSLEDHLRLPLTTAAAQGIANLGGMLLTTPWIEYQLWRHASVKLQPTAMVPNQGANMEQYAAHSRIIDEQIRAAGGRAGELVAGIKKGVVVANFYKRARVLLFGWYRAFLTDAAGQPIGAPDVFDDGKPMITNGVQTPNRQPIQPRSNIHDENYLDYSHGIRLVGPIAIVNGQAMPTIDVYVHPVYGKIVNLDPTRPDYSGALKVPRYPTSIPPAPPAAMSTVFMSGGPFRASAPGPIARVPIVYPNVPDAPSEPSAMEHALDELSRRRHGGF